MLHGWPPEQMGGTGLYVAALEEGLAQAGVAVSLVAPTRGPPEASESRLLLTPSPPLFWEESFRRRDVEARWRAWLRLARPDLVHVHHLSGLSFGLPRIAAEHGIPTVLTLHDYAIPCARGQLVTGSGEPCGGPSPEACAACLGAHLRLDPLSARLGGRLRAWPGARAALHQRVSDLPPRPSDTLRVSRRIAAVEALLSSVHTLLSPSHDLARRFADLGLRRPEHAPLPLIRPIRAAPTPPPGPLRLLFASAILPTKGPDRLLAAFGRLPVGAASLTLAGPCPPFDGDPSFAERLRAEVARTPNAHWKGEVRPDEMQALLDDHDVLVLPSTWPENSPLVIREATAAGLRVVVSREGGAAELCPGARLVGPIGLHELEAALQAELHRGRGRQAPLTWTDPLGHAHDLLAGPYARALGPTRNTSHLPEAPRTG